MEVLAAMTDNAADADLEWSQVEFGRSASLHVRRVKNGKPSVHPLPSDEKIF